MTGILISGYIQLKRVCAKQNPNWETFITLKTLQETLYPAYVISGIRYTRLALNPVWVVSLYPLYVISGIPHIRFAEQSKGGTFCSIENLPQTVISDIRCIRTWLNTDCNKSGMGCVIVKGDLPLFTALKTSPRNAICGVRYSL